MSNVTVSVETEPEVKEIQWCRVCRAPIIYGTPVVLDLGEQYVVDFVTQPGVTTRPKAPLQLARCGSCNLVQLRHTVRPDLLFNEFWYRSGINEMMREALFDVVASALHGRPLPKAVLDIGCNDGTLLGSYPATVPIRVGVDPATELCAEALASGQATDIYALPFKAQILRHVLEQNRLKGFDIVTAIAMFYDVEDPLGFLQDVKRVLAPGGIFVAQLNSLKLMLKNLAFDNISHEHLCYYSLPNIKDLLFRAGLALIDASENAVNGGSFRVVACREKDVGLFSGSGFSSERCTALLDEERQEENTLVSRFEEFAQQVKEIRRKLAILIRSLVERAGTCVYIYGASTRGTALLQSLSLDHGVWSRLSGAADRNPKKWGRYMVGTWIKIVSEEEARKKADYFLVLPWHLIDGILTRESAWMERGGELIVPLPRLRIIDRSLREMYL